MSFTNNVSGYLPVQTFDVSQTWLAGMTQAQLLALYGQLQQAQAMMAVGGKPQSVSYDQGGGGKSVTFNITSVAQLLNTINMVQRALGMPGMSRRPMRPVFM